MPQSHEDQSHEDQSREGRAPGGFRKVGEQELFRGSLIQVANATFEDPAGRRFERDVVHHPGAVVVVPVTASRTIVMVRQFRAAIGQELLELPAGKRDVDGEDPETTAARELAEEVGKEAAKLELLARFYNSPGFTDELSWLYLATDLQEVPDARQGFEEQQMSVEEVPLDSAPELIRSGKIMDAKSIIGLSLAAISLGRSAIGVRRQA
ncbi:MAG TPA: NUDIX hydrolase [Acidimicrobiales bacterium]